MRWLILIAVISCRGDWVTEVERQPVTERRQVNCTKSDICWLCDLNLSTGAMDCGFQISTQCPGKKWVLLEIVSYEGYYKNRPDDYMHRKRERRIKDLTECE